MAEVRHLEGKEHELAMIVWLIDSVDELDRFATTFNYMYKIKRDHLLRIEEINKGLYAIGKEHPDGHIVYSMKGGEN